MVSSLTNRRLTGMEKQADSSSPDFGEDLPRSQFYCRLDDMPDHLTPAYWRTPWRGRESKPRLIANPDCFFTPGGRLPEDDDSDLDALYNLAVPHDLVWVREPTSG